SLAVARRPAVRWLARRRGTARHASLRSDCRSSHVLLGPAHFSVGSGRSLKGFYLDELRLDRQTVCFCWAIWGHVPAAGRHPVVPSGDIEADMRVIRDFYVNVTGRHPERAAPIRLLRTEIPS